jgi:L-lactate dehydrogenase complex protein LldE
VSTLIPELNRPALLRDIRIGLFIPCYIDLVYPEVGIATLELSQGFGLNVECPVDQTCCGKPMSNSGDEANAVAARGSFFKRFLFIAHMT